MFWFRTWIGGLAVDERLIFVLHEVGDVPHLVVDGDEVGVGDGRAHLDAEVLLLIKLLGGGMAHNLLVVRFLDHALRPEGVRHLLEPEADEELLGQLEHPGGRVVLAPHLLRDVQDGRVVEGLGDVFNVVPLLSPHVAQKVGRNIAVALDVGLCKIQHTAQNYLVNAFVYVRILLSELGANVGVKLLVEALERKGPAGRDLDGLAPHPIHVAREVFVLVSLEPLFLQVGKSYYERDKSYPEILDILKLDNNKDRPSLF